MKLRRVPIPIRTNRTNAGTNYTAPRFHESLGGALRLACGLLFFDVDRADLRPDALGPLSVLAAFLNEHPERIVEVEGHTDSTGTPAYNMDLSRARAEAVRTALVRDGVDPSRIEARGFGETAPLASNRTAAGRLQNRRVEIIVPGVSTRTGSRR